MDGAGLKARADSIIGIMGDVIISTEEGNTQPLSAYLFLKQIEEILDKFKDQIKKDAISEAEKWGEKSFSLNGAKITVRSDPATWKYDNCEFVLKAQEDLKKKQEMAKNAWIAFEKGTNLVTDDGEIIPHAIKVPGGTNISIKFDQL